MKYSVYNVYNELLITDNESLSGDKDMIFYEPFDWNKIISVFDEKSLCLITQRPDAAFKEFQLNYKVIEAAGGLILNGNDQWLMIYRLNKWDLPKGKMDKGETPLQTAIREIMEECNVHLHPNDCSFLEHIYHTYMLKEKRIFKKTHWFLCYHKHSDKLIPQTEENIEKVEWVHREQWNELKENSYPSIVQVVQKYLSKA